MAVYGSMEMRYVLIMLLIGIIGTMDDEAIRNRPRGGRDKKYEQNTR